VLGHLPRRNNQRRALALVGLGVARTLLLIVGHAIQLLRPEGVDFGLCRASPDRSYRPWGTCPGRGPRQSGAEARYQRWRTICCSSCPLPAEVRLTDPLRPLANRLCCRTRLYGFV